MNIDFPPAFSYPLPAGCSRTRVKGKERTTMWVYHSPIGDWHIISHSNGYHLVFDSDCYGIYSSANAAADDVYCFATGYGSWDTLERTFEPPQDISEWEAC
jgi:hypothetical protein